VGAIDRVAKVGRGGVVVRAIGLESRASLGHRLSVRWLTRRWSGQLGDLGAEFESVDCRST
jgi:hypothetical protein